MQQTRSLPTPVRLLGLSGLLPQMLCLTIDILDPMSPDISGTAAMGLAYAALILSFLGGMWWMAALQHGVTRTWPYLLAVLPSLLGWIALFPMAIGFDGIGIGLTLVGVLLLGSPLVDRALVRIIPMPAGWITLRVTMATGLGLLTLLLAMV